MNQSPEDGEHVLLEVLQQSGQNRYRVLQRHEVIATFSNFWIRCFEILGPC